MVETTKWQVKSIGAGFIVFDPKDDFRTVAECRLESDAQFIVNVVNAQDGHLELISRLNKEITKVNGFRERLKSKHHRLSDKCAALEAQIIALRGGNA